MFVHVRHIQRAKSLGIHARTTQVGVYVRPFQHQLLSVIAPMRVSCILIIFQVGWKRYVFGDMDLCLSMKAKDESLAYQVTCFGKEISFLTNFGQISCFSSFSKVLLLLEPNVCIIIVLLVLYTAIATFSIQIVT